jgi:diaminopimelate decarboxylase
MEVGGVPVSKIAYDFGTPVYVIDKADFDARLTAFKQAFTVAFESIGTTCHLYYASKANLNKTIARWAYEQGMGIDTASGGEFALVQSAGIPASAIAFHGNNKSDAEIRQAVEAGVGQIIVDSLPEVEKVAKIAAETGVVQSVMVRVTTGVHAGGHEFISTAHEDQKFGLSINPGASHSSPALDALFKVIDQPSLKLLGLHSHIGSQILDAAGFKAAALALVKLASDLYKRRGVAIEELDLGGGYGIAYLPGETPMDPQVAAAELAMTINDAVKSVGLPLPRIAIEPGRSLIGGAGITLYSVGTIKPVHVVGKDGREFTRTYVSTDGGMSDNIRPMLYGAKYHAELANRTSDQQPMLARLVGKHCESGDILIPQLDLPGDISDGDIIAIAATGAYGRSMASNYNMLLKPPVVAVEAGKASAIVRRETVEDLLALDLG